MKFQGKTRHRLLAICLCVMLATVMLAGCGDKTSSDASGDTATKQTETAKDKKASKKETKKEKEKKKDEEKKDSSKAAKKTTSKNSSDKTSTSKKSKSSNSKKEKANKGKSSNKGNSGNKSKQEQSTKPAEKETCTISISAKKVLSSSKASEDTKALAGSGTLLSSTKVEMESGDTVKDITKRVCGNYGVTLAFGDSGYISGIGGICEFDAGQKSGWMYSVNGTFPSKGIDEYTVKKGDVISWKYTLNMGKDL